MVNRKRTGEAAGCQSHQPAGLNDGGQPARRVSPTHVGKDGDTLGVKRPREVVGSEAEPESRGKLDRLGQKIW